MSVSRDHRPWLILSLNECRALRVAALKGIATKREQFEVPPELARALRQIDLQERWIDGWVDGDEPNVQSALMRQEADAR